MSTIDWARHNMFDKFIGYFRPKPKPASGSETESLVWSQGPSCFERHLQRRYRNSMFDQSRRNVTQTEVDAALAVDNKEAHTLRANMVESFQCFLNSHGNGLILSDLKEFRSLVESHAERAAQIGGLNGAVILEELHKIWNSVFKEVDETFNNQADVMNILRSAKSIQEDLELFSPNTFVAQMLRTDTPIHEDEVIPSLLMESLETIKFVVENLPEEQSEATLVGLLKQLQEAMEQNQYISDIEGKFQYLLSRAQSDTRKKAADKLVPDARG